MDRRRYERIMSIILAAIGGYAFFKSQSFHSPVYPATLSAIICLGAIVLFVKTFIKESGKEQADSQKASAEEKTAASKKSMRAVITIVAFFLYIILLNPLGFIIDSILLLGVLTYILGFRRIWIILAVSIPFSFAMYFFFTDVVHISLPSGILPF